MKARRIQHAGESWVNENDLRVAMNDDDLITNAAAMLKVSLAKKDKHLDALRKCIAYFYTELTGALAHKEN